LAFNIVARIDDLVYVDDLTKRSDNLSSVSTVAVISHRKVSNPFSVPVSGTPYKTTFSTPSFSPVPLISPARGERTPFLHSTTSSKSNNNKPPRRGFGVKRALTNYLAVDSKPKMCGNTNVDSKPKICGNTNVDSKPKICGNTNEGSCPNPKTNGREDLGPEKNSPTQKNGTKLRQSAPKYIVT